MNIPTFRPCLWDSCQSVAVSTVWDQSRGLASTCTERSTMSNKLQRPDRTSQLDYMLRQLEDALNLPNTIVRKAPRVRPRVGGTAYLLLDCSSSMAGLKLAKAKEGATDFSKDAIQAGFSVGLVSFDSSARIIEEPSSGVDRLVSALEALVSTGSTNMSNAIAAATEELKGRGELRRVIVVVTDGMPNSPSKAIAEADRAKAEGIEIITIGTEDADRDFLVRLASGEDVAIQVRDEEIGQGIVSAARLLSN